MGLNIYDVIFWEASGELDTIYTVAAETYLQAVELAENDRCGQLSRGAAGTGSHASAVSLLGPLAIPGAPPQILHGPFREKGYTRGETWLYDPVYKKWFTQEDYDKPREPRTVDVIYEEICELMADKSLSKDLRDQFLREVAAEAWNAIFPEGLQRLSKAEVTQRWAKVSAQLSAHPKRKEIIRVIESQATGERFHWLDTPEAC